jgi:HPt (histidine-containing phosphotransfer) domain-containing protein
MFDPEVMTQLGELAANGRRDFVERVVGLYLINAPRCVADLRTAAGSGCAEHISEAAHALKSMSYTIGASGVAAAAAELEQASLDGAIPEMATTEALDILLRETLAALDIEDCSVV